MIWITPILIMLAGILNAVMDVLKERYKTSIFANWKCQHWIDPKLSWKNKWDIDKKIFKKEIKIIDKIMSTSLVFVTDMWHFSKTLMLLLVSLSIVLYQPIFDLFLLDALLFYLVFTITFEIFFSKILIKNEKKC